MDFEARINELKSSIVRASSVEEIKTINEDIRRVREAYAVDREMRAATHPASVRQHLEVTDPEQFKFEAERRLAQVKSE